MRYIFSYRRHFLGSLLLLLGVGSLFYRYFILENNPSHIRTLWILDTSLSMAVEDISSENHIMMSRFDLAKKMIQDGIRDIPGEHAIITYARDASMESPFTENKEHSINVVLGLNPVEFYGGSNLMGAISLANTLYAKSATPIEMILLSDGGLDESSNLVQPLNIFHISIIGIGTTRGGKIPLGYDADGNHRYKYFNGQEIIVGYDDLVLKNLSDSFHAFSVKREYDSSFPSELIHIPTTERRKNIFLLLGTIGILIGYFFHPYAQRK